MTDQDRRPKWYPSARQQAFDWYMTRVLRALGASMIVWELGWDLGKNPLVILGGLMLATSNDTLGLLRGLIEQAKQERKTVDDLLQEEHELEQRQELDR